MVDAEYIEPWIQKAENDISSAQYLAQNMYPAPTEIICFHCQQAAEKYLKAFLVYNDQEPPKTHDLIELAKLCNNFNENFPLLFSKCEYLLPFAARTRYPSTVDPKDEDMKRALSYARDIIDFIKSKMPMRKKFDPSSIKALALDLDGTALLPDTSMGEKTARRLKRLIDQGIQVMFCTGRAIEAAQTYYNAIGADGPMVFFNGAEVAEVPNIKLISSNLLNLDVVDYGIDLARSMDIHFQVFFPPCGGDWEQLLIEKQRLESEMYSRHTGITPVVADIKAAIASPELNGVIKAMFIAEPDVLAAIRPKLTGRFGGSIYITGSYPTFLEIMSAGVSKGEGLKTVMECRGLKPEEVLACGDEENDLPMFKVAGFSAAPSSAKEKIRQAADYVFGPNTEEGLAGFLEEYWP
ncbi:MAG: Cof-type HAD-IIB family hydrolase [Treponema sp.]|jgi:Cof subfamily protein (haloacid dehalogenase superfamily)|nr:Cof-type HAD-IIB family hydrolase [Treponema sp.]